MSGAMTTVVSAFTVCPYMDQEPTTVDVYSTPMVHF